MTDKTDKERLLRWSQEHWMTPLGAAKNCPGLRNRDVACVTRLLEELVAEGRIDEGEVPAHPSFGQYSQYGQHSQWGKGWPRQAKLVSNPVNPVDKPRRPAMLRRGRVETMDALTVLRQERDRLSRELKGVDNAIRSLVASRTSLAKGQAAGQLGKSLRSPRNAKKRVLSPEARRKMSEGAKKAAAARKKATSRI